MSEKVYYYQVVIRVNHESLDEFEQLKMTFYNDFECDGIEDYSISEEEIDSILGDRSLSGGEVAIEIIEEVEKSKIKSSDEISINYYFYGDEAKNRAKNFFNHLEKNYGHFKCELLENEERDWNEEWKKFYSPTIVSENIRIVPSWFEGERSEKDIIIYPGFGFGTGDHPTTFLCLQLFDEIRMDTERKGIKNSYKNVLDFGCGSGILGIAAAKFLTKEVSFYDIDQNAIVNTIQNLELNSLDPSNFFLGDKSKKSVVLTEKFDFIFANILLETLKIEKDSIDQLLIKNGCLILSGILKEQLDEIIHYYTQAGDYELKQKRVLKEWCALELRRNK